MRVWTLYFIVKNNNVISNEVLFCWSRPRWTREDYLDQRSCLQHRLEHDLLLCFSQSSSSESKLLRDFRRMWLYEGSVFLPLLKLWWLNFGGLKNYLRDSCYGRVSWLFDCSCSSKLAYPSWGCSISTWLVVSPCQERHWPTLWAVCSTRLFPSLGKSQRSCKTQAYFLRFWRGVATWVWTRVVWVLHDLIHLTWIVIFEVLDYFLEVTTVERTEYLSLTVRAVRGKSFLRLALLYQFPQWLYQITMVLVNLHY